MKHMEALRETVARLRGPGGCPWDREQTHRSLADCLIEECCELLECIDREDYEHMREELGDVLLQVVLHAQMAEEEGHFNLEDVAAAINGKLIRRHPHVFGEGNLDTADQVRRQWDEIKSGEGARAASGLEKPPPRLPALLYARNVFKQMQKKLPDTACPAVKERAGTLSKNLDEEKAGRRLFELAAACRLAKIDPEAALRRYACGVFEKAEKQCPNPG